jgi:hypothetical protein
LEKAVPIGFGQLNFVTEQAGQQISARPVYANREPVVSDEDQLIKTTD